MIVSKKFIIFILVISIFNDFIFFKIGNIKITTPKIVVLPVLLVVILYLIHSKAYYINKLILFITLIFFIPLMSYLIHSISTPLSFSIIQSTFLGILYMEVIVLIIYNKSYNTLSNFLFFLKSIIFISLINVIFGILQTFTGKFYISNRIFELGNDANIYRASGLLSDPNYYAQILIFSFFISLFLYDFYKLKKYLYISLFMFIGILLSGSRSGMLITFFTFLISTFLSTKRKLRVIFLVSIILIILTLFHILHLLPVQIEYFFSIFDFTKYGEDTARNSLQDRTILLIYAFHTGIEHMLLGVGVGNFPLYNPFSALSHNSMFEMFAEYGLLGLIYFLVLFLFTPIFLLKKLYNIGMSEYKYLIYAVFGYSLMSLTLVSYYSKFTFIVFIIMIMISYFINIRKKSLYENN